MHNIAQSWYTTQKLEANMKTCKTSIILSISTNSTKITQTIFEHHIFKSQQKLKNQEIKGYINMKYFEKNRKSIPFLEVWRRDDDENGGFFRETRWVCERDERTRQ